MRRKGFVLSWQNRHWCGQLTGAQGGAQNPNIPPGGSGPIQDFTTSSYKGQGIYKEEVDEEIIRWVGEVVFLSPVMQYSDGRYYRFIIQYTRPSRNSQSCSWIFGFAWCDSTGRLLAEAGNSDCQWDSAVIDRNGTVLGTRIGNGSSKYTWNQITTQNPQLTTEAYDMMENSNETVRKALAGSVSTSVVTLMVLWIQAANLWSEEPFTFESQSVIDSDIVERAMSLSHLKYWYGGDGRVATVQFANSLRSSYPSIWTATYYNTALADVGQQVGDCSYLCNYAYGKASPGNHGPGTSSYPGMYSQWTGAPKNGMILWRSGHCGIYNNGQQIELANQREDFKVSAYNPGSWSKTFYDKNRRY